MLASSQTKLDIVVLTCLIIVIIATVFWQVGQFGKEKGQNAKPNLLVFALIMVFVFVVMGRHVLRKLISRIWNSIIRTYINIQRRRREAFELKANRYGILDSSKQEIRLLTIEPGQRSDPIRCTLRSAVLGTDDCDYEALSYTWGSALDMRVILLNDIPFSVTSNLDGALRHLRSTEHERTLWVDAVCINQFKVDERNQQVAFMREIYQHASRVLIWLGNATPDSDFAFDFMAQDIDEETLNDSIGDDQYTRKWTAIRRLFSRDYWNRVWIIQEVAMSTSPIVHCGTRTIDWATVVRYDSAWQSERRVKFSTHGRFFATIDKNDQGPLRAFRRTIGPCMLDSTRREVTGRRKSRAVVDGTPTPNTLLDLIQTHWMANATDPRDQIFALIGIASDREMLEGLGFKVDYGMELSDVYRMLTRVLFLKTGTVNIIGFAGIADRDEASSISKKVQTVSSWIPTWSSAVSSKLHLAQINLNDSYIAAGTTKALAKFEGGMLTLKGRIVDRIHKLGPRSSNYRTSTSTDADLVKVSKDINTYYSFAVESLRDIHESGSEWLKAQALTNLAEFWRVLVGDRTVDGFKAPEEWAFQFRAIVQGPMDLPEGITSSPDFDLPAFIRPFQEAVLHTMSSRRLFITHGSNFGVGPPDIDNKKDEIVVFLGYNVPMVVRRVWTLPNRYQRLTYRMPDEDYLKGYAYLQNHMVGDLPYNGYLGGDQEEALEEQDSGASLISDDSYSEQLGMERTTWRF